MTDTNTFDIDHADVHDYRKAQMNVSLGNPEIQNRFGFHAGNEETIPIHKNVRKQFMEMANFLDQVLPPGRAEAVAMTNLEDCSMWSNKAVAELAPIVVEG